MLEVESSSNTHEQEYMAFFFWRACQIKPNTKIENIFKEPQYDSWLYG